MSYYFYLTPEILLPFSPLTSQTFDLIRHRARASWQEETRWSHSSITTYAGSYRKKHLDEFSCSQQCWPECNQIPSPNGFASPPAYCLVGPQKSSDLKGLLLNITGTFGRSPLEVKHGVAHQVLFGDLPPNQGNSYGRMRKPITKTLKNFSPRGQGFRKQFQQHRSSTTMLGSPESSEANLSSLSERQSDRTTWVLVTEVENQARGGSPNSLHPRR